MSRIIDVRARQISDSRGNPTVEAEVTLSDGALAIASVPSGASTGSREAVELRDTDGRNVSKAVANIKGPIQEALRGQNATEQAEIDRIMTDLDGTNNLSNLGANATLAVSWAIARAASKSENATLHEHLYRLFTGHDFCMSNGDEDEFASLAMPVPLMNVINGGEHANNGLDPQELMIVPAGFSSFSEAFWAGTEVFHRLKGLIKARGWSTAVGDEGGFAPMELSSTSAGLDLIMEAVGRAGYGDKFLLALDIAASELYRDNKYHVGGHELSTEEMIDWQVRLAEQYPIVSIEDGLDENDWDGWAIMTKELGDKMQLVGDDLFVTQSLYLQQGINSKAANAILIKPNQNGTVSGTLTAMRLAKENGFASVVSHRSGETEDASISSLAVATSCGQIKTGSLSRTDRMAKYNQLLRIEEQLMGNAVYQGQDMLAQFNQKRRGV